MVGVLSAPATLDVGKSPSRGQGRRSVACVVGREGREVRCVFKSYLMV